MAKVVSVNISLEKGTVKTPVASISLRVDHGIEGDAHAGDWHRQISLLAEESIDTMRARMPDAKLDAGMFAENITTRGLVLYTLPIGTRLRVGGTELEITQIGKECHQGCDIRKLTGDCVMPREGVFAVVITPGEVRPGDPVEVIKGRESHAQATD